MTNKVQIKQVKREVDEFSRRILRHKVCSLLYRNVPKSKIAKILNTSTKMIDALVQCPEGLQKLREMEKNLLEEDRKILKDHFIKCVLEGQKGKPMTQYQSALLAKDLIFASAEDKAMQSSPVDDKRLQEVLNQMANETK